MAWGLVFLSSALLAITLFAFCFAKPALLFGVPFILAVLYVFAAVLAFVLSCWAVFTHA